uniref:Glycosyltransferase family 92 protein n=1 Tax=viral metagenome TaxID=1070528 RepID=A0A6C0L6Q6_9ZZZZ
MHDLSVGCLFKNETHSIVEWLEHYIYHGVTHFYLINDKSDDDSCSKLTPYVEKGIVTLFHANWGTYLGRQRDMYNHFILPILRESKWLMMLDMDEYAWSPHSIDLKAQFDQMSHIGQVQVEHTLFGSSGHISQPTSIVKSFIKRSSQLPTKNPGNLKYFVNCSFTFTSLNVHHATFADKEDELHKFLILNHIFRINHYSCQSREFWEKVKCTRGDSDNYRTRTARDFSETDLNDVEDTTLLDQNSKMPVSYA